MVDWEEIEETLNHLWDVFVNNLGKIITLSTALFLSAPIIKWGILSLLYAMFKTPKLLELLGESTAFNLLPWWVDLLTNPIGSAIGFILIVLFVTSVIALLQKENK